MTQTLSMTSHVCPHASMFPMPTPRRSQTQVSFRLDDLTAEEFRDWLEREAIQKQLVLETLVRALVAGDLPDIRELRIKQIQSAKDDSRPTE
ncbi:hypothetical protein [Nocardia testacea]|uniref:hypothetical protein n=1 Tax=Nocardia testacea TaxID=248551 RepID=UPI0033DB829A